MDYNKLSKAQLIKKIEELSKTSSKKRNNFEQTLFDIFGSKSLVKKYGNQHLNYVAIHDLKGNYLAVNYYLKAVFEKELQQSFVKNIKDIVDPENLSSINRYLKKLNTKVKTKGVLKARNLLGNSVYLSYETIIKTGVDGALYAVSFGSYITDILKAKLEVSAKQKELEEITKNSPSTILKINQEHEILFSNILITDKQKVSTLGKEIYQFILPEYHQLVKDKLKLVFKKQKKVTYELEGITPTTGIKDWYISYASPIIENGLVTGAIISTFINNETKKLQEQSKISEDKYRKLTEVNPNAIIVHQDGKIKYCNPAGVRLVNAKNSKQLINQPVINFLHPDYREMAFSRIQKILETGENAEAVEEIFLDVNGNEINVEVSGSLIDFEGSPAIQIGAKDITNEIKSKITELRYGKILDTMSEGVIIVDEKEKIHYVNQRFCEILGYQESELLGQITYDIIIPPEEIKTIKKAAEQRLKNNKSEFELKLIHKSGDKVWVYNSGTPYKSEKFNGSLGVITDITETKKLRDNQSETLKNIDEIIYRLKINGDPIDVNVLYASKRMYNVIGYKPEEFTQNPSIWLESIHKDDIISLKEQTLKLFSQKKSGIREYRFKHKITGKYIWLEDKVFFKKNEKGDIIEQFGVSRDITSQKEATIELKKTHAKFKNLFESSRDAVIILKDDEVIDCNFGSFEMFGKNKVKLKETGISDIILPVYKNQKFSSKIENAKSGIPQKFEWLLTGPHDDTVKVVEVIINRLFLEDGSHLQLIIRDISEQMEAKVMTEASEKSFRELFNNSSDMIFIIGEDGFFNDVNKEALIILEYSKKELSKMTTKGLSAPGQSKDYSSEAWKGKIQKFEWTALSKSGKKIEIEISLKKAQYFGKKVLLANARDITENKINQLALKSSEAKFRRLFSTANDAIFILDNQTFIDCNEQTLKMFDCKRNEIVGHPPYEFSPKLQPDGRESLDSAIEKITDAISGKSQRFYWKHTTKKGIPFDAEVSLNHFELDGKTFIQAIVRDISEQMEIESALKLSEAKFKTIADNAPVLIRMTDRENKTYFFSNQLLEFFGKSSESLKNKKWYNFIHQDEKELVIDTHNQAFKSKVKFEISYRLKNHLNNYRWVLETGIPHYDQDKNVVGFITASIDITGRKTVEEALKSEESLRKSNELFRNTLENISLAAVSLDNHGKIIFCNDHFAKILKTSKKELLGENWFEIFVNPKERKERKLQYEQRVKSREMPKNFTSAINALDNSTLTLSWHNIFLKDEKGRIIGVTSIGEDITKNKHDELVKEVYNNINNFSMKVSSLKEFYAKAHEELKKLFKVNNFYVSLHNKWDNKVKFPYFIDENVPEKTEIEARNYKDSLSEFVINSNKTQVLRKKDFIDNAKLKKIKTKGKIAEQWVGVPLRTKKNAFGILAVQDYKSKTAFSKEDIEILSFISNQISLAIEKIHNEQLLLESEKKFRNIFENLQDLYYRTDLEGNFVLISPSVEKFTGVKPDYFIGKNVKLFYSNPIERDRMLEKLLEFGFINNFETIMIKPDGKRVFIQANVKLTLDENGDPSGVEGMVRDVTDILEAQRLIRENEEKFRNIFENLQDMYYRTDLDGYIETISPSIFPISGYKPEEVIGKHVNEFYVTPENRETYLKELLKKGSLNNYEILVKAKDGRNIFAQANNRILLDENKNPIGIEGMVRDITDIKQTEEDLKLFENIIQNNWDAIVFADLNGKIKYINEAANKLYGYDEQELIGENVKIFNSNLTHNTDEIVESIQNKGGWVGELKQKKKDGVILEAILSVQLIFNKNGDPIGMASHSKDISDRIREGKELLTAKELAESSLKVKEQFLANMSHELRTPMNGIIGIAELLKDTPLKEDQDEFVSIIQKSSSNLLNILNDILDLSKIEAGKIEISPTSTSIDLLLKKLISLFEYQIKNKKISLDYILDNNVPSTVMVDETRLIQVLSNLISNAIKFTYQGGIKIEVNTFKIEKGMVRLLFKVIDSGVGIKKEEFGKLFNYFSQLDNTFKKEHKGTGLGLAISKELVNLMGGEIGIQSKEGEGSTFWFTIDTKINELEDKVLSKETVIDDSFIKSSKILIVDDNKTNLLVAQKLMEKHANEVYVANSGFECLDLIKNNNYDMVFMDIQMPEMDGIETLNKLKEMKLKIPIIAMTAYAMKEDKQKFIKLGFDDYLPKPINGNSIYKVISKWAVTINPTEENDHNPKTNNEALEQLRAIGGDDFVNEVLADFDEETKKLINELKKCIKSRDLKGCKDHFHTLKGSSGTIGIMSITNACQQAEIYSKQEKIENIQQSIEEISNLFNTFRQEFIHSGITK